MIFSLNSAGVRVFFALFLRKNFVMAEGAVLAASAGEHAAASFCWVPLLCCMPRLCGGHASVGGGGWGAGRVCWDFV